VGKWLGYDYDEIAAMADLFWADATSSSLMPVAWFCRRAAHEHAGFLEFVWRMADRPFRVVDLTGLEFRPKAGTSAKFAVLTTGELAPEQIIDARLIERQTPLEASVIDEHRATWRDLRAKNAPLRSVSGGKLASAPITLFDELILSCASRDWQKGARIVATALARLDQYASDLLLWARIRALGESGAMEIDGDPFDSRYALVRRSGSS